MQKITFKVQSFRKLPNPYKDVSDESPQIYYAICDVTEIPDDFPMETNPREQNLNTSVAKKIERSLSEESEMNFFLLNRGILLSVKEVKHENAKGEISVVFEDLEVHGNVDGGHTYEIIKSHKNKTTPGTQFVKLEILTGVEDVFTKLASARNTSVQVADKSIAELEQRFEIIKGVLDKKIVERIAFKQNEKGEIDISEILAILNLFNLHEYPNNQTEDYPIQSYSGKATCTKRYIEMHEKLGESVENPYVKMKKIIPGIFMLYNQLETRMADYYSQGNFGGRYGSIKGVSRRIDKSKFSSKFYGQDMDYSTPTGFIYPILGAFRSLIVVDKEGYYSWAMNPFDVMDTLGKELVGTTIDRSRTLGNNPQSVGKDKGNWRTLFITVKMYLMEQRDYKS